LQSVDGEPCFNIAGDASGADIPTAVGNRFPGYGFP